MISSVLQWATKRAEEAKEGAEKGQASEAPEELDVPHEEPKHSGWRLEIRGDPNSVIRRLNVVHEGDQILLILKSADPENFDATFTSQELMEELRRFDPLLFSFILPFLLHIPLPFPFIEYSVYHPILIF
jgi:hypothetical protein